MQLLQIGQVPLYVAETGLVRDHDLQDGRDTGHDASHSLHFVIDQ